MNLEDDGNDGGNGRRGPSSLSITGGGGTRGSADGGSGNYSPAIGCYGLPLGFGRFWLDAGSHFLFGFVPTVQVFACCFEVSGGFPSGAREDLVHSS